MSATQAFADRWRRSGRSAATLVQIDLKAGIQPAVTVYAAHAMLSTPNGVWWEPLLVDVEPISAPGVFGTADIPLCSTRIKFNNRKIGSQSGSLASLMVGRAVIGSTVTIYLWETGLTQFSDALVVFKGVVQDYEATPDGVTLNLRQRTDWNRAIPSATIEPSIYPRAPEAGRGAPLTVAYGKVAGPGLRLPHTPDYSLTQRRFEMLRGPRGLGRGAVVDTGRGGTSKPKVLATGHKVASLFDPAKGTAIWMDLDGKMVFVNAQAGDVVNTATAAGVSLVDDQHCLVTASLGDVKTDMANPARNPRYCLEPNDVTFSELEYAATPTTRDLEVFMGAMPELGIIFNATPFCVYESSLGTGLHLQWRRSLSFPAQVDLGVATVPTLATGATVNYGTEPFTVPWADFGNYTVRVYYSGASSIYVKVYCVGLLVDFVARRKVLIAARSVTSNRNSLYRFTIRKNRGLGPELAWTPYADLDKLPETTELAGDYYWNVHGMGDGAPLVAGVIDALLEQAPHLYAHILGRFGGQGMGGNVEAGVGVFGSYIDATADFNSWTTRAMPFAFVLSQTSDVMTTLSHLAASSLSFIYINRFDDRFHIVPWRLDRAANWFFTFTPREVNELAPECRMTPGSSVVTGLRLSYGWNEKTGGFADEAVVAAGHSAAGQKYINLRDENATVVDSVNDRIDFVANGTFACTLTVGAYTPAALARHAQIQMNAADPNVTREHYCSYAGVVTNGHNDRLVVNDGAVKIVTLDPGTYTMEQLAAHAMTKLNAASTLWTVAYSRTTGKFTFSRSSGTTQLAFDYAAELSRGACVLFGFRPLSLTGSLSYTGDVFIEEQRFVFGCANNTLDLRWATGANGSEAVAPRTAASLFGFDARFDYGRTALQIHVAPCPKSNRETTLAASEALYGRKREATYPGRFIYDGETAREMRNRISDLYGKPRMRIQFTTEHAPDLERGRVIAMSGAFDSILPYPEPGTDGSWTGKRFVVVETEQNLGPLSYGTRIVAVSLG